MSIISLITDTATGGTFVSWSMAWLSGRTTYFNWHQNKKLDVPCNPLTDQNAHVFNPNQPQNLAEVIECYSALETEASNHTPNYVYFHDFVSDGIQHTEELQQAIAHAFDHSSHVIRLRLSESYTFFYASYRTRSPTKKFGSDEYMVSWQDQHDDLVNFFFAESHQYWTNSLNLRSVWDHREFLALNLRPYKIHRIDDSQFSGRPYLLVTNEDCWFYLDRTMQHIFDYVGLQIDQARYRAWVPIFHKWRELFYQKSRFCWYFDRIVDAVLDGSDLDLAQFDLDIVQEATIQHELLYKHNLNLRTFKLKKFTNTLDLHRRLEPNIHHTLETIY